MSNDDKHLMFEQTRYDIHMASAYATEIKSSTLTADQASELLRRCVKANASCQAWERVMRGIEPPQREGRKLGGATRKP